MGKEPSLKSSLDGFNETVEAKCSGCAWHTVGPPAPAPLFPCENTAQGKEEGGGSMDLVWAAGSSPRGAWHREGKVIGLPWWSAG